MENINFIQAEGFAKRYDLEHKIKGAQFVKTDKMKMERSSKKIVKKPVVIVLHDQETLDQRKYVGDLQNFLLATNVVTKK